MMEWNGAIIAQKAVVEPITQQGLESGHSSNTRIAGTPELVDFTTGDHLPFSKRDLWARLCPLLLHFISYFEFAPGAKRQAFSLDVYDSYNMPTKSGIRFVLRSAHRLIGIILSRWKEIMNCLEAEERKQWNEDEYTSNR
jgi:hypothetical protein